MTGSAFHEGEVLLQNQTGERMIGKRNMRFIGTNLPKNGPQYLAEQRFLNLAISDRSGQLWSFVVSGEPGYIASTSSDRLTIQLDHAASPRKLHEILAACESGWPIGLVTIDLARGRRFRVNGRIDGIEGNRLNVGIEQTCPNCPKYIQKRTATRLDPAYGDADREAGTTLTERLAVMLRGADTLFTASRHPTDGHDASHRGGLPGFVRVDGNRLVIPDYIGNSMFMTLGNLTVDPACGLTVVDFDAGLQLNLSGTATIDFTDPSPHDGASGRFWTFEVEAWNLESFQPSPGWVLEEYSRFNLPVDQ